MTAAEVAELRKRAEALAATAPPLKPEQAVVVRRILASRIQKAAS